MQNLCRAGRKSGLFTCLIVVCGVALRSAHGQPALEKEIQDAEQAGDLPKAEAVLTAGLARSPEDLRLLFLRADLQVRQQKLEAALNQIRELLKRDPKNYNYRFKEAQYLGWLGRFESASKAYRSLLEGNPADQDVRTGLGLTLYWRGDWHSASNALTEVLRAQPDYDLAFRTQVKVLAGMGRASEAWRMARGRDRETGEKDGELGLILANLAVAVDADDLARELASRATPDADLQRRQTAFIGQRLAVKGRKEEGVELVRKFAESHADRYDVWVDYGNTLALADRLVEAEAQYERAVKITPERAEAHLGLARLATRRTDLRGGLARYQGIVARNPEQVDGWRGVIGTAILLQDWKLAESALASGDGIAPKSAFFHEEALRLALREGNGKLFGERVPRYLADQPEDRAAQLWEQRWAYAQARPIDGARVEATLDPLLPEQNKLALRLLAQETRATYQELQRKVPSAPEPGLEPPAAAALAYLPKTRHEPLAYDLKHERIYQREPLQYGMATGYEYSALRNTTGTGASRPDWQEYFASGYVREPEVQSLALEYRWYRRFDSTANQVNAYYARGWMGDWMMRLNGGAAASGDFIPRWRLGGGGSYRWNGDFQTHLDFAYLKFADVEVFQFIPGLSYRWNKAWSSDASIYVSENRLRTGAASTSLTYSLAMQYQYGTYSWLRFRGSFGDEGADNVTRNLIGGQDFWSAGVSWRIGSANGWSLEPGYRFERHQQFEMHAISLGLRRDF